MSENSGSEMSAGQHWWLYRGTGQQLSGQDLAERWPAPPPWRDFRSDPDASILNAGALTAPIGPDADPEAQRVLGSSHTPQVPDGEEVQAVNTALYLRRPLLVTGDPGTGKSSLAHRISRELGLGRVLRWPITSRTTVASGQYTYDAIGRVRALHEYRSLQAPGSTNPAPASSSAAAVAAAEETEDIGQFIHLGPLGTALLGSDRPRVLLIDELDKGDIDLPNDLLTIFEEGRFVIPELVRIREKQPEVTVFTADPGISATVRNGIVQCVEFPIIVMTSNAERAFPAAFRRRCLPLELQRPSEAKLVSMVAAHFPDLSVETVQPLVEAFLRHSDKVGGLAADQFLNAVQLVTHGVIDPQDPGASAALLQSVWHPLTGPG